MLLAEKLLRKSGSFELDFQDLDTVVNTANLSGYTFSSVDLGTVNADRMVAILVSTTSPTETLLTATINGVSATISGANQVWVISAKVPAGSTGDVVLSFQNACPNCRIKVFAFNTKATGVLDSNQASYTLSTVTVSLPNIQCKDGGVVIGCFQGNDAGAATGSWNGTDSYVIANNSTTEGGRYNYGYVLTTEDSAVRDMSYARGDPQPFYSGAAASFEFIE